MLLTPGLQPCQPDVLPEYPVLRRTVLQIDLCLSPSHRLLSYQHTFRAYSSLR
jgi:hypothetical protein